MPRHALLVFATLALLLLSPMAWAQAPASTYKPDLDNSTWGLNFPAFFQGENRGRTKNLNVYPRRENGVWTAAVATTTNQGRPSYNTMLHMVDMSGVSFKNNRLTGTFVLTLAMDPWVPDDAKPRVFTVEIDALVTPAAGPDPLGTIKGTWKSNLRGGEEAARSAGIKAGLEVSRSGEVTGAIGAHDPAPAMDNVSVDLTLPGLLPGRANEPFQRRKTLSFGVRDGQVISTRLADVDIRNASINHMPIDAQSSVTLSATRISGSTAYTGETLEGESAQYRITFSGERSANMAVGVWTADILTANGVAEKREGHFRGSIGGKPSEAKYVRDDRPWFRPVANHVPVRAGEHPRLFFRKSDLPALRERAKTPQGQAMVARLRKLLNGGDGNSMPTVLNPATKAYAGNKFKPVEGNYSICHAAGFGFLYQLTGDTQYADLARQCMDLALKGQRDFDDRYAWDQPGGELRAGPTLGWYAVAYDLCYDAWDSDYRRDIALRIQNYKVVTAADVENAKTDGAETSLRMMVLQPRHGPSSNHYGATLGGCGLAVLAIKGDPGTDDALLQKFDDVLQRGIVKGFTANGFGDGGFFNEGAGPGQIFSDTALVPYIQALRVSQGRDYVDNGRPNVAFMTLLRVYELVGPPAIYPYRSSMGGSYGGPDFFNWRNGLSRSGQFSQGFGAIPDRYKAALLHTFNTFVEPNQDKYTYDTVSLYPHRPMLALINWPLDRPPQNPAEVLPKVHVDNYWQYYVFRNAWSGPRDIVVTNILRGNGVKPRGLMVWGFGNQRLDMGETASTAKPLEFKRGIDGSGSVVINPASAFVIDFSKASGADALVIRFSTPEPEKPVKAPKPGAKPDPNAGRSNRTRLLVGELQADILTLHDNQHPVPTVEGQTLVIGKQKITFDGTSITFAQFTPAP